MQAGAFCDLIRTVTLCAGACSQQRVPAQALSCAPQISAPSWGSLCLSQNCHGRPCRCSSSSSVRLLSPDGLTFSVFLLCSPERRIYFFIPVRCYRDILQVCHRFHSCPLYVMAASACGFTGRRLWLVVVWTRRKLIHRQLHQLLLVHTRRVPGLAFSLAGLSHALLWEAPGERCLFSSGWPQSPRSVRHEQLFGSWVVLWLPVCVAESWWGSTCTATPMRGQSIGAVRAGERGDLRVRAPALHGSRWIRQEDSRDLEMSEPGSAGLPSTLLDTAIQPACRSAQLPSSSINRRSLHKQRLHGLA